MKMNRLRQAWQALRMRKAAALAMDVALILAVFWAVNAWNTRDLPAPGERPPLSATLLDGGSGMLPETGTGLVYFFAPWCTYCKLTIGHIDEMVKEGRADWVRAVALDYADADEVRAFVADAGLRQPVMLGDAAITREWNIRAFPTYFVIGKGGQVTHRSVGYATKVGMIARLHLASS